MGEKEGGNPHQAAHTYSLLTGAAGGPPETAAPVPCVSCNWLIFSLVGGTLGADGAALDVWMTTLGSKAWGWTID